jgi:Mn-dependent DtxR family transcriptional regulator
MDYAIFNMSNPMKKSILNYLATFEQDCVPKGWYRSEQVANSIGRTPRTVTEMVKRLRKHNQVEERKFRVMTRGGLKPVVHYKFTKEGQKVFGLD